ncbi:tannase [Penicillium frequentans]|uniref:Carboxylic ester hydrolase n=1 Tax=Penicillium frequentans TaxID=3151616 RepID=A0AAD6CWH4_9EURO|nr:tannase [Penicillium glabrum]
MKFQRSLVAGGIGLAVVQATSLKDVCTTAHAKKALPASEEFQGLTLHPASITANAVYNASTTDEDNWPDVYGYDYCNVTMAYSHNGIANDKVLLEFWLPAPEKFQNRWLSTGGFGYAINGDEGDLPGGVVYGAVSGQTDGGYGSFSTELDAVFLLANGTINRQALYMQGYQAHYEMSMIGKAFSKNFYDMGSEKLYAYYQGCSEGGREGWSQVQRFPDEWDGAVIGAPAIRMGQQQVNHLYGNLVEHTMGYYPPPCELEMINNLTIKACDALDGKVNGVVGRTDLCKLHFNINSTIGHHYHCAASSTTTVLKRGLDKRTSETSTTPAQNGTVTAEGVAVAAKILDGLHTLDGKRAYIWYQPTATFDDADTEYNSETGKWELDITSLGGEWVARFLELRDADNIDSLDNVTYDTMTEWMIEGWKRYEDVLQTTWPDLTPFQEAGGKIIHYHGESDPSIPTGSSVHYHEMVRKIMYGNLSFEEGTKALNDWNRLYLVPGAAHCAPSDDQPNGPFPRTTLETLIEWVENGDKPDRLNATIMSGAHEGEQQDLCAWPLRPLWKNNGTTLDCVFDKKSYDTWTYDFDAYDVPLY